MKSVSYSSSSAPILAYISEFLFIFLLPETSFGKMHKSIWERAHRKGLERGKGKKIATAFLWLLLPSLGSFFLFSLLKHCVIFVCPKVFSLLLLLTDGIQSI